MTTKPEPKYIVDYFEEKPEGELIDGSIELLEGVEEAMEAEGAFKSYDDLVAEMHELSKPYFE
jgi:hypothetical protein